MAKYVEPSGYFTKEMLKKLKEGEKKTKSTDKAKTTKGKTTTKKK